MIAESARPTVGVASRQGQREFLCDAAAHHRFPDDADGVLAVAVVDGISNDADVATAAYLCAENAVRIGARWGATPGVMAAAGLLADTMSETPSPDAVIVLAVCRPGTPVVIAHVGDCRAFGWDGTALYRHTDDHTHGARLRAHGVSEDVAARSDRFVVTSLATTTVTTISVCTTNDQVIVLTSDGAHKALSDAQIAELLREHTGDAGACAQAIVDAAHTADPRDDATAAVIILPPPRSAESGEGY